MIRNADDIIRQADIVKVVGQFVTLAKHGKQFEACCPFHAEKTASFKVDPSRQIFKCFGCGEGGDAAAFVMRHEGKSFPESVEYIARICGSEVEYDRSVNREEYLAKEARRKSLKEDIHRINQKVLDHWFAMAWPDLDKLGPDDLVEVDGRTWKKSTINSVRICPVKMSDIFPRDLSTEDLLKAGLMIQGQKGPWSPFKGRIIFPYIDRSDDVAGFTGRRSRDDQSGGPKYMDSSENPAFNKGKLLFGIRLAKEAIIKTRHAYLVEGPTDFITMYDQGITNTVASCGKELSIVQASILSHYCDTVTIFYDNDANHSGHKGALRAIPILLKAGLRVKVLFAPEGHDPDSFLREHSRRGFEVLRDETGQDGVLWAVTYKLGKGDMHDRAEATELAATLLAVIGSEVLRSEYTTRLTEGGKKALLVKKSLSEALEDALEKERSKKVLTNAQEESLLLYGVYEKDNAYWVSGDSTSYGREISNFVMKGNLMVSNSDRGERVLEIVNTDGFGAMLLLSGDDSSSLSTFRKKVENMGNFLFWGSDLEYIKVKRKLFAQMDQAIQIQRLGYHHEGFWSWGNGISTPEGFIHVDDDGVVVYNQRRYFLPAFSKRSIIERQAGVEDGLDDHRRFIYPTDVQPITMREWARDMHTVHGRDAYGAVMYAITSIFRDIVFHHTAVFPILNLYGEPGAGKNYLASSMMSIQGKSGPPFLLHSGTEVGLSRTLSKVNNGMIWVDEYNNAVRDLRIQKLKGVYDGTGHEKGTASSDNRTFGTRPTSGLILSGQEMPVKDPALFTRCVTLVMKRRKTFSKQALENAMRLKEREERGVVAQLTGKIYPLRDHIHNGFDATLADTKDSLRNLLANDIKIHDRVVLNHAILLATWLMVEEKHPTGWTINEVTDWAVANIRQQCSFIAEEDDRGAFWNIFQALMSAGRLRHGEHYLLRTMAQLNIQHDGLKTFPLATRVIMLYMPIVHAEYAQMMRTSGSGNPLPIATMRNYLMQSDYYIGSTKQRLGSKGQVMSMLAFTFDDIGLDFDFENEAEADEPAY